jgi:hypothetical protein
VIAEGLARYTPQDAVEGTGEVADDEHLRVARE